MSLLRKLLEGAAAQVNPFDNGQTFSSVMHPPQKPHQPIAEPQRPMPAGINGGLLQPMSNNLPTLQPMQKLPAPPDITYDPTGRAPYSARTPEMAQLGNIYVQNPMDPRVQHMDPKYFGFPADNTVRY